MHLIEVPFTNQELIYRMVIEQIYTGCLAQGAYYIESNGEAAIIDPLRESEPYIQMATKRGAKIKYVFETHFHADFVSGHIDLAKKSGAKIIYGPLAETKYEKYMAKDQEEFILGDLTIRALHTPGHTLESTTYLLLDENKKPHAIFTGDTLFIGDVGRPDLCQKSDNVTKEDLAGMLYDSLREKIMVLPDDVLVYPAHGAGSACGKNMSKNTWDTLGNQKTSNYALNADLDKDSFIKELTSGLTPPPQYFAKNAFINKEGYSSLESVKQQGARPLSPNDFEEVANLEGALVLDVRNRESFVAGFIPNSIFIGLDGSFAPWVGALVVDIKQPILLVAEDGKEEEAITRLARVGYDNTIGYLAGGFNAWKSAGKDIETVQSIKAAEFATKFANDPKINVLDVRKPAEFAAKHIVNAQNFALDFINGNMSEIDKETPYFIHCAGGYRSTISSSILKARGYHNFINVQDSFSNITETDIPTEEGACQFS